MDKKNVKPRGNLPGLNKNPSPFVLKLWQIVNDPANNNVIRWMPDGKSFQVVNKKAFENEILPKYYKTKNITSFIRQLNMYGWHKVQDFTSGSMQNNEENWQFQSPHFIKNHPELLEQIVRNKTQRSQDGEEDHSEDLSRVLKELEAIKKKQIMIGDDLFRIRRDNELLWNEYYQTRERYDKHSQMLGRILRFLASVWGPNHSKIMDVNSPTAMQRRLMPLSQDTVLAPSFPSPQPWQISQSSSNGSCNSPQDLQKIQNQVEEKPLSDAMSVKSAESPSEEPMVSSYMEQLSSSPRATLNNALIHTPSNSRLGRFASTTMPAPPQIQSKNGDQPPGQLIKHAPWPSTTTPTPVNANLDMAPYESNQLFLDLAEVDSQIAQANSDSTHNGQKQRQASSASPDTGAAAGNAAHSGSYINDEPERRLSTSSLELDHLSQQLALQDNSLQQVQDWIQRLSPDGVYDPDPSDGHNLSFDVNEFLIDPQNVSLNHDAKNLDGNIEHLTKSGATEPAGNMPKKVRLV